MKTDPVEPSTPASRVAGLTVNRWSAAALLALATVTGFAMAAEVKPVDTKPATRVIKQTDTGAQKVAVRKVPVELKPVKATEAEATLAKTYSFRPANIAEAVQDNKDNGVSLVRVLPERIKALPKAPKLNITKFGETIHAVFKDNVRGYALGVRKGGPHVYTLQWDAARTAQDGGKGWTLDTRMHTASVGKLMTAIIATKMLDERNLSIDTKIGAYIPGYWNEGANAADLTFRELLTHRAAFTIYDGDYLSFKKQIEQGVSTQASDGIGYTNGSFSLVRVLNATMTGAVNRNSKFEAPIPLPDSIEKQFNDMVWDVKTQDAFLKYAQTKVFTPSGVNNVASEPSTTGALAYSGKSDSKGWNSGDVGGQLGGSGFRLSVNEVLNVMGTFRRSGKIVSPQKAQAALDASLGIDQIIDTPAGKIYNKNGRWGTGSSASADTEQCVAYFMPEDIEVVVFVNSWIGTQQASLRGTVKDAYLASLE